LHASRAPIWGIGRFAVDAYQDEFGPLRTYQNIPYFSNLSPFFELPLSVGVRPSPGAAGSEGPLNHQKASLGSIAALPGSGRVPRTILFSGSLIERKGVDLLARAFARLAPEFPGLRLRVMGEGELHEWAGRTLAPVASQVEFLGFKDWSELAPAYAAADILCVPSRYDGWGLVVPEGLAAGLPVIATERMGAALEFLENGRNGWLIPAGDEHALYHALREAASSPAEKVAAMSAAARASVAHHTLAEGAGRFLRAAHDAISTWPKPVAANVGPR
jgi:glycosyltransferase involved in cell wall biosynthesis